MSTVPDNSPFAANASRYDPIRPALSEDVCANRGGCLQQNVACRAIADRANDRRLINE
jgi:hypothetical protein